MNPTLKVAILTTDKRESLKKYSLDTPAYGTAPEALLQGFAGMDGVEVHVISCMQQPVQTVERIAPNVFPRALHVPKSGWMRTLYRGCVRAVRRDLAIIQPAIVHGQGTERDCALSAVLSGYPNVLTIHGNMRQVALVNRVRPFSFHWLAARLETFAVRRTQGIICISDYTRDLVKAEARQTWLLPNAVDASFFNVERPSQPEGRFLVVGTICVRKNQNFLIRSLDSVANQGGLHVHFAGDYSEQDPYHQEFLGLISSRPWCSFSGFANRDKLKQMLSESTALLIPSLEDNCPMAVLEAAAAGVPAIGSRVGGIPGLIDHGVTGLLFPLDDAPALCEAVRRLLLKPAEAAGMGRAAKAGAIQRFAPRVIAQRHLDIYRELLNKD